MIEAFDGSRSQRLQYRLGDTTLGVAKLFTQKLATVVQAPGAEEHQIEGRCQYDRLTHERRQRTQTTATRRSNQTRRPPPQDRDRYANQ